MPDTPDMPESPRAHGPGDDLISGVFDDFPLDADLRELYLRLRLDGAVWRSQQPADDGDLAAYAVALAEDTPTHDVAPALAPNEPRAAPATRKLRERTLLGRMPLRRASHFLGGAMAYVAVALIVALLSVTLLRLSPLSLRSGLSGPKINATPVSSATAASTVTTRFTPAPGITVTVHVAPTGSTPVPPGYTTPATTGSGALPTPSAIATATTTSGSALTDDSTLVTLSPTSWDLTSYGWVTVSFVMLNTGTTTWDSSKGYAFKCVQTCWNGAYSSTSTFLVSPGQNYSFVGDLYPAPAFYYGVYNSTWQLYDPATGYFGQQVVFPIINHGWNSVLQEASPSCQGDGAQWVKESAAGSVSCGASSLVLAQGGTSGVSLALLSTPATYDYGHYYVQTHVHFTSTSASTFAGIVISTPGGSITSRPLFMVSPAGYFCYTTSGCDAVNGLSMPASSDFDISVEVDNSGAGFYASAGGSPYTISGGMTGGGPTGLIEMTASGSTDAAYFTSYQLYQYK